MNREQDRTRTLFETWDAVVRYRWRFILATFGVTAGVLVGSFLLPRKYKAEAVFERRTDMVLTEITDRGASKSFLDSQRGSLVEEIAGQIALDEMIDSLQVSNKNSHLFKGKSALDLQNIRSELVNRITVRFDIGTKEFDRIRISFIHHDQELARAVVNTLVENYIIRTRNMIDGRLEHTAGFFHSEVERNRKLIEQLENRKLSFEIDHAELLPNFPGSIQLRLNDSQHDLGEIQQQRAAVAMRIDTLRQTIEDTPEITPQVITSRNPRLDQLEAKLAELQGQLKDFLDTYKMTDKHPDLVDLKNQIAGIEKEIGNTEEQVVSQKHLTVNLKRQELDLQLSQAVSNLQAMDKQIESLKEQIARLNLHSSQLFPIRSEYRKLTRQIEKAQRQVAFWEENLRRVKMALTAETGNRGVQLNFVKPCGVLHKPISPDLIQVLMAAVVLGMAAGGVNVFIAYRTDDSCTSAETVADSCNLPLLGAVSEIISRRQRVERRVRNMILYPLNTSAMAAVLIMVVGLLYLNLEKPMLWEQLKENPTSFLRHSDRQPATTPPTTGKE